MKRLLPIYLLVGSILSALNARAVIVAGGDGTQNTTATGAGAGWNYTGSIFYDGGAINASGVYLGSYEGSYWVLTAYHVASSGLGSFAIGSNSYSFSGSAIRLSSLDLGAADLVVVKITPNDVASQTYLDSLANLNLADSSPGSGTSLTMIGSGRNRATSTTTYYVDTDTDPYTWSTSDFSGSDDTVNGYQWASGNTKRWGTNTAESTVIGDDGFGNMHLVSTQFDLANGDAQAAIGDSGGGVFLADGTLSGLMLAIDAYSGQPGETAVDGNSTYYADISYYRSSILAAVPEPGVFGLLAWGGLATCFMIAHRRRARARGNI